MSGALSRPEAGPERSERVDCAVTDGLHHRGAPAACGGGCWKRRLTSE